MAVAVWLLCPEDHDLYNPGVPTRASLNTGTFLVIYSSQNDITLGAWDFGCSFGKLALEFRRTPHLYERSFLVALLGS